MGQIALANLGFSPGPIDGLLGSQTRGACAAFQQRQGLPISAQLDTATRAVLLTNNPSLTNYIITAADLARLAPVPDTWLGKSLAGRLGHSNIVELLAEKGWAYQSFVRRLNPSIQWNSIAPGTEVRLPDAHSPQFPGKASRVRIFLAQRTLQAFDEADRIIVHFPCSIAQRMDKRPLGDLRVTVVVSEPDYTFDPEVFPESEEGQQLGRRLRIPPGPNNPVGLAWIGLDRPGYGIHGTPDPEKVGRTESHGCFRLANWNAVMLLDLTWEGMPVSVLP